MNARTKRGAAAMFRAAPMLLVAATLLFGSAPGLAVENVSELLRQADALDAKLDNARAVELYLRADRAKPNDPDTLWKIARQYALLMNDTKSDDQQKELAEEALEYAKRAVAINPGHAKAVLSVAICYGRLVRFVGPRMKVELSRLIKENAERALELDPTDSYAYHVLGAWNYELAQMGAFTRTFVKVVYGGMPAASIEEAEKLFRKAVELAPNRVSHRTELGRTYAALGKIEDARNELRRALSLPNAEKDDPESKRRASDALSSL
jgi:tetratricopeptide (TPR) repeat protein